ncbi:MAG: DNA ligase D [Bryobacterales bacterium]|nr:DNA ligase D [Bryobacterales bacterium]
MSLKEYARKRKFDQTPEPEPSEATPPLASRFFVQRHDATRLHYDFRLEMFGVLKSWAVPKGPSLDPEVKSLAVHVEDHPLDYGAFEGNIPEGNYGAGSVMLWDQGTYELLGGAPVTDQYERGDVKFRLMGEKLRGAFALVRMKNRGKGNEWLLIKKRDEAAVPGWDIEQYAWSVLTGRSQEEIARDLPAVNKKKSRRRSTASSKNGPAMLPGAVAAAMPESVTPMLASLASSPPAGEQWVFEVKWDGVRAICYVDGGKMRIVSRNGLSFNRQYPELSVIPHHVRAGSFILDGEIAALDEQGRSRFELIQSRIMVADANAAAYLSRKTPVFLFAFDLLYWDGYDLRRVPLLERKKALEALIQPGECLRYSRHFQAPGAEIVEAARRMGIEGVIAKQADSLYEGKRSSKWLKIKIVNEQDAVICGFTHGEREFFSSLILGIYDKNRLTYAGNAGTGFNGKLIKRIYEQLGPLITETCPFRPEPKMIRKASWVSPELVCRIKYTEWTAEGRLRAPVFLGLRSDIDPRQCVRESPGHNTAESAAEPKRERPLLRRGEEEVTRTIDGRSIKFTNLNKLYYPDDGYTKRDVVNYYDAVAAFILPHLQDRPLSLKRYPNGIHGEFFFQKDIPATYPSWLRIEPIHSEHRNAPIRYVVADDRATLLYLANLGCIDQNPWMSRIGTLDYPDFILIDLDPLECSYDQIVEAARITKSKLDLLGLEGVPKTTGGDGMHVYVPLEAKYTYEQVRSFAELLSYLVIGENPDLFTTPRTVTRRRKGRVYFDYLQNSSSKTIAAPYVLRAHPKAPVSTPLRWAEVKSGLRPEQFTIANAVQRFNRVGDLFAPVLENKQTLEGALQRLSEVLK